MLLVMAVLAGCATLVGEYPSIAPLPTLTPSPAVSPTPALAEPTSAPGDPVVPTATLAELAPPAGAASPAPFDWPSPGASASPAGPAISYFVASPEEAAPGEPVLLFWSAEGIEGAIYRLDAAGVPGQTWQVEPEGSLTVSLRGDGEEETFVLAVTNGVATVEARVVVGQSCAVAWYVIPGPPGLCPAGDQVPTDAAAQRFERGWMFWLAELGQIVVLYDEPSAQDDATPAWQMVSNPYVEGMPEDDPGLVPPEGMAQPRRGFGLVWRDAPTVRDRLGWATGAETPFSTTYQLAGPEGSQGMVFTTLDGQVILLVPGGQGWLPLSAEQP